MVRLFVLLVILNFSATQSEAKSWQEAIDDVHELAERYRVAAENASGEPISYFLGTAHGSTDVNMHQCAILGRRMGFV